MAAHTPMLHVRVDDDIKEQATQPLTAMGLSMSDAVREFLRRVVIDPAFPSLGNGSRIRQGARRAAVPSRRMGNSRAKT